jgi:hypothetical protein
VVCAPKLHALSVFPIEQRNGKSTEPTSRHSSYSERVIVSIKGLFPGRARACMRDCALLVCVTAFS